MPTLFRLLLVVLVLGIFGFGGMVALSVMVDPGQKDITIKIPASELVAASEEIDIENLPAPVNVAPRTSSEDVPASIDVSDSAASDTAVKTVDNAGTE